MDRCGDDHLTNQEIGFLAEYKEELAKGGINLGDENAATQK